MPHVNPVQVQKFLGGMNYPATRDDVMDYARENGADDNIMHTLERLPSTSYETPADISQAIGNID